MLKFNRLLGLAAIGAVLGAGLPARADTVLMLPVQPVLNSSDAREKLDGSVQFFFGATAHPRIKTNLGSFTTNKKTNGFGKSHEEACSWVLLSALIELQERAQKLGGNAVVNIVSYYKRNEVRSNSQFECHSGAIMAGVALKGDVVKLAR